MQTSWEWVSRFKSSLLGETYVTFDPAQYDRLFDDQLEKVIARTQDPAHRQVMERMRGFNWLGYIAASVRHAGFRDQREVQERTHDVVVKLLVGKLFRGFDQRVSGPMDLRFKRAVGNAIRNMAELERNRRRLLPTVPLRQEFEPGSVTPDDLPGRSLPHDDDGERVIQDFRRLVRRRLGELGAAVLDVRMAGGEVKSLVGSPALGSPGKWVVKKAVQQVKSLAREFAASLDDPGFLRDIERAMGREEETVEKRRTATAGRRAVGA